MRVVKTQQSKFFGKDLWFITSLTFQQIVTTMAVQHPCFQHRESSSRVCSQQFLQIMWLPVPLLMQHVSSNHQQHVYSWNNTIISPAVVGHMLLNARHAATKGTGELKGLSFHCRLEFFLQQRLVSSQETWQNCLKLPDSPFELLKWNNFMLISDSFANVFFEAHTFRNWSFWSHVKSRKRIVSEVTVTFSRNNENFSTPLLMMREVHSFIHFEKRMSNVDTALHIRQHGIVCMTCNVERSQDSTLNGFLHNFHCN